MSRKDHNESFEEELLNCTLESMTLSGDNTVINEKKIIETNKKNSENKQLNENTTVVKITEITESLETAVLDISLTSTEEFSFIVVDNINLATAVIKQLKLLQEITFDCEGVDLGRSGKLTVITLSAVQDNAIAFIFDIETLIHKQNLYHELFGSQENSLKELLESENISKICFDCRSDSDGLWHQYQVNLTNCIDLQVYHQGILRNKNQYHNLFRGRKIWVTGLSSISTFYCHSSDLNKLKVDSPHRQQYNIWEQRPLSNNIWRYAANDVHIIRITYKEMSKINLPESMKERIKIGSDKYISKFREYPYDVNKQFRRFKNFILEADDI